MIEYLTMPVAWTWQDIPVYYGTVNAEPVTIGERTFEPEQLLVTNVEFNKIWPFGINDWLATAHVAFDDERPKGWNYARAFTDDNVPWKRIVDTNGNPPYPVASWELIHSIEAKAITP